MPEAPAERPVDGCGTLVDEEATPVELIRAMALLGEPPDPKHRPVAEAVGLGPPPEASEYSDVFIFQLYPYGSIYLGAEGMMGGEARSRIAGFWQAVGRHVPGEPDHLSALLGLYASLAEEESAVDPARAGLVRQARRAALHEHLAPWVFHFLARVEELGTRFYAEWARVLGALLKEEIASVGPSEALSKHLRDSEGLPDPRTEGAGAFVSGLLAPVRSGMILTRADLARIAKNAELGLRAGERRYALEHLLAQDAPRVLDALAAEVDRQASYHEVRREWLGDTTVLLAERARAAARLLEELRVEDPELPSTVGP